MKQMQRFNLIFASIILGTLILSGTAFFHSSVSAQGNTPAPIGTCADGADNDGDGRADWAGATIGGEVYPPDPSCINKNSVEQADVVAQGSLVPCTNKCDLASVFTLLNTFISFLIKVILFPVSILMFVYAGYQYITAQGNPAKTANVKKLVKHLVLGIIIILTAWVVVRSGLSLIGYDDSLYFFTE